MESEPVGSLDEVGRVRRLVAQSVDDPLAPFVLRPGKRYVFSPNGRAALGYRIRFGVAVVGGDPVGDPLSWPQAIDTFLALAHRLGHEPAVLGAGERARELWAERGLGGVPIGRDVVVRPEQFALVGRRYRNLRQAIQRTHNVGVSVTDWFECEVPSDVRTDLQRLLHSTGRDASRGFSMILGRPFDGSQPGALILVARDREGRIVGGHRYLRAGEKDLSLDVPVRAPAAPNGIDERLIAEAVRWAGDHGVRRVSLAFAPFPDLFAGRRTPARRVAYGLVHLLDPLIRVERLYRYLRKFQAFDQQRFVMLRWRHVVRVAASLLSLEFLG